MKLVYVAILSLLPASAGAVDFSKVLLNDEGKPICLEALAECPADKLATLGRVVRMALNNNNEGSGEEKYKRADLAASLVGAGDIKVKAEDIVIMKKAVSIFPPGVVKPAWDALEGK